MASPKVKRESRTKLIKTGKTHPLVLSFYQITSTLFRYALCMTPFHILPEITVFQSNVGCFAAGSSTVPGTAPYLPITRMARDGKGTGNLSICVSGFSVEKLRKPPKTFFHVIYILPTMKQLLLRVVTLRSL